MPIKWKVKEKDDAKKFGGRINRGSGNRWYAPGDVKTDDFLIESKQTSNGSYSLSKKRLQKIYDEALFSYRIPMMSIRIQDVDVVVFFKEDWEKITKKDEPWDKR